MTTEKRQGRATRHGFWFGIAAGIVLGAVITGAAVTAAPVMAARAFSHGFRHKGSEDPEALREHASYAVQFALGRVGATEAQQAEVERIVTDAISELLPLGVEHRAHRDALHEALLAAQIDPEAIERLRRDEMALAEEASHRLSAALAATAEVLTVEQRAKLAEMGHRFHR